MIINSEITGTLCPKHKLLLLFRRSTSLQFPLSLPPTNSPHTMDPARRSERLRKAGEGAATVSPVRKTKATVKQRKHPTLPPPETDAEAGLPEAGPPEVDPPANETNPANITRPISTAVHPNLKSAWRINQALPMHFLFDSTSPARQFKRGMPFDERKGFPEYENGDPGDITENDVPPDGLMPYMPRDHLYANL